MRLMTMMVGFTAAGWACAAETHVDPLATRGGWEVGLQGAAYEYDEPNFALLEGERIGVSGSYTFLGQTRLHSRIEARYSYAELDYTGSGTLADVPDYLFELRALVGRDYRTGKVAWVPHVGVGLRYLINDLRGTSSTGAIGYRRKSRYWYVPLGVTLRVPLGSGWVMAPQAEYDAFVSGSQRSYLADTGLGYNDVTNEQRNGRGARVQLAFEGPRWSVSLWSHYWDIEDSDIQPIGLGDAGMEPANKTRETGVEVRYRF
jgi:hypothetical protein